MSSSYVRSLIKQWLALGTVPFHNTENEVPDVADDVWCTVEWSIGSNTRIDFCKNTLENSTFNVVYMGQLGVGDDALLALAESEIALLMTRIDPNGMLFISDLGVPHAFSDDKNFFCISVPVEYEYQP